MIAPVQPTWTIVRWSAWGSSERGCSKVGGTASCTHIDSIEYLEPPGEIAGCEECLELGMTWVHLRMCQRCGHVGCCDNSPGKHATAHFQGTGHPLIRSAEPGEDWSWCYVDEAMFRIKPPPGQ